MLLETAITKPTPHETCFFCNAETGRECEDSIYDDQGNGPYCDGCYDKFYSIINELCAELKTEREDHKKDIEELINIKETMRDFLR